MPYYDYACAANGRVVNVSHGMSTVLSTWGDVCAAAEIEPGETPRESPVEKLMGVGGTIQQAFSGAARASATQPTNHSCGAGCRH